MLPSVIVQELREALTKLTPKHVTEQAALMESYQDFYRKWHFQLRSEISLLSTLLILHTIFNSIHKHVQNTLVKWLHLFT